MSAKRKNPAALNLEILELIERELMDSKSTSDWCLKGERKTRYFHHMLVDKTRVNNTILRLKIAGEQWINLTYVRMLKKVKTLKFNIQRLKRNSISKKQKEEA